MVLVNRLSYVLLENVPVLRLSLSALCPILRPSVLCSSVLHSSSPTFVCPTFVLVPDQTALQGPIQRWPTRESLSLHSLYLSHISTDRAHKGHTFLLQFPELEVSATWGQHMSPKESGRVLLLALFHSSVKTTKVFKLHQDGFVGHCQH